MSNLLLNLVSGGGILAIFVLMALESAGIPISSEVVVPFGGYLASTAGPTHLSFALVVAAASLGNLAGSLAAYWLSRRYGETVVLGPGRRLGLHAGHLRLADRFFARFGLAAVFLGRLLPIVRTYVSFPAGMARVPPLPFTVATILGAIPWNLALAWAGLQLGANWERVGHWLGPLTIPVALLVVVLLGAVWWLGQRVGEDGSVRPFSAS